MDYKPDLADQPLLDDLKQVYQDGWLNDPQVAAAGNFSDAEIAMVVGRLILLGEIEPPPAPGDLQV